MSLTTIYNNGEKKQVMSNVSSQKKMRTRRKSKISISLLSEVNGKKIRRYAASKLRFKASNGFLHNFLKRNIRNVD